MAADGATAAVFVPVAYDASEPSPVLVLFHGAHQRGQQILDRFVDQAKARGVILIAPNSDRMTWDLIESFGREGSEGMSFGGDVARIDSLLTRLFEDYAVDPERVAVAGFSDGASYALSLGLNNAEVFRSVIAIAPGLISSWPSGLDRRVLIVHGERDRILPIEISRDGIAPQLRASGLQVDLTAFEGGHELADQSVRQVFDWLAW